MPEGLQISDAKANYSTTGTVALRFHAIFCKFIKGFSKIAEPLHAFIWKGISFKWDES